MKKLSIKIVSLVLVAIFISVFIYYVCTSVKETDSILYVNADIKANGTSYLLSNQRSKIIQGKVKENKNDFDKEGRNLICSFLDEDKKIVNEVIVKNPLEIMYDSINKGKKDLVSPLNKEQALSIRINYDKRIKSLSIKVSQKDGTYKEISNMPIENKENVLLSLAKQLGFVSNVSAAADTFETVKIVDNGPDDGKIVLAILGDGYTKGEQGNFIHDAKLCADGLLEDAAIRDYKNRFNVYAVKVISNVSGAAKDPDNLIDNYFGSSLIPNARVIDLTKINKVNSVLQTNVPQFDQATVIVNDNSVSGCAIINSHLSIIAKSTDYYIQQSFKHEFAHCFAYLHDEYDYGESEHSEGPNITKNNDPSTIRWKKLLNVNGVGMYEIRESTNWYIPYLYEKCKMGALEQPFCPVCANAIKNTILSLTTDVSLIASSNGNYISANNYGDDPLIANRNSADTWEKFNEISNFDGTISFRSGANGKYVCADLNQSAKLIARSTSIDTWEKFKKVKQSNGTIALLAMANKKYVCSELDKEGVLYADRDSVEGAWGVFTFSYSKK